MRNLVYLAAAGMVLVVGCGGGSDNLSVVPVSGKITWNGQPLPNAAVVYLPGQSLKNAPTALAKTDQSGAYALKLSTTDQSGAVPGAYRVRIRRAPTAIATATNTDAGVPGAAAADADLLPEQTFEVPKEGTSSANFDIQTATKK